MSGPRTTLRAPAPADRLVLAEAVAIIRQAGGIEPAQGSPGVRVAEPAAA